MRGKEQRTICFSQQIFTVKFANALGVFSLT